MRKKWIPSEEFVKKVVNFPGHNFDSLYGKRMIPTSEYTILHTEAGVQRPCPYFVGHDDRHAGKIWKNIESAIKDRAVEILENDIVRKRFDSKYDYVGKLQHGRVTVAKEIILPERFVQEIKKHKKIKKNMSITDSILSGEIFVSLKQTELLHDRLANIIKDDGASLGDKTMVDIGMFGHGLCYPQTLELMGMVADDLRQHGYKLENKQLFNFGNYADINRIKNAGSVFVGEDKLIEPVLPCGKTLSEKSLEWDNVWEAFRNEQKRGMHKIVPEKRYDERGKIVSILYKNKYPNIPCGFRNDTDKCAPKWCGGIGRGEIVEVKGRGDDHFLNDQQRESVSKVADIVKEFFEAFRKLREKEDGHR